MLLAKLSVQDKIFVTVAILSAIGIVLTCLIGERPDLALLEIMVWSYFGFSYAWKD
jgi:hypothetical protein